MDKTKLITSLVILCLASAVAAFLMPPAHGALLSFVSIASAAVIAVLAVVIEGASQLCLLKAGSQPDRM